VEIDFVDTKTVGSKDFQQKDFGLGDPRVIMELLSSKIYARPKYIIVQEVASNARDANREAGRADEPITIKLPNRMDDNLRIIDHGIGIAPERIKDVFVLYGNSTKRGDNVATGGFGIGAKTPFIYSDSWTIKTTTDDPDGRRVCRSYVAHKDTGTFAKLSLVNENEVDKDTPTGTEIAFAVAPVDFSAFINATRRICKYWDPRPNIIGAQEKWDWHDENVLHEGKNWKLIERSYYNRFGSYRNDDANTALVFVDGIPYTLRLNSIFTDDSSKSQAYKVLNRAAPRLFFNVGEISVSATREDLDYSDKTIKAVRARAEECLKELTRKANKAVEDAKTLWEASIVWEKTSHNYSNFMVEPKWRGHALWSHTLPCSNVALCEYPEWEKAIKTRGEKGDYEGYVYSGSKRTTEQFIEFGRHVKVTMFKLVDGKLETQKRHRRIIRDVPLNNNVKFILDDCGGTRPNRLRLQTYAERNPTHEIVAVVEPKDQMGHEYLKYVWHWDDFKKEKLSAYPKAKNKRVKNGKKITINAVKKLQMSPGGWTYKWEADKNRLPEDTKGGVYVLLLHGNPVDTNGATINMRKQKISRYEEVLGVPIYGILWKYRKKISSSWTDLSNYTEALKAALDVNPRVKKYLEYGTGRSNCPLAWGSIGVALSKLPIECEDLKEYFETQKEVVKYHQEWVKFNELCEFLGEHKRATPKRKLEDMAKKLKKRYSLVTFVASKVYGASDAKEAAKELVDYINWKAKGV